MEVSTQRSYTMRRVKAQNTTPEMKVRKLAHAMGYRYRLHSAHLSGKPDLTFPSRRKVVFVHGCFWHGHNCKRGARMPKTNRDYWCVKISANRNRDKKHYENLTAQGWGVLAIWECELSDLEGVKAKLDAFLSG